MNWLTLSVIVVVAVIGVCGHPNPALKEVYRWKTVDFLYPDEATRKAAVSAGHFLVENNLPLGLEVWKNKLFVTVPRWKSGIAASLTYIDLDEDKTSSPLLRPYPDWKSHQIHDKDNHTKIVSTFRVKVDECDRLWVLDTGVADILGTSEQITPPKILIYDLRTDKLLHQFLFDKSHIKEDSFFPNVVVDIAHGKCDEAYAYIPDLGSYALIVYSLKEDKSFRVTHHFFKMDPLRGNFNVAGINFQWTDGLFGLALGPVQPDGSRTVYFHPMSSFMEFTVSNKVLQNETAANNDYYAYKVFGNRGEDSQSTSSSLDLKTGVMFYTLLNKNGVGCWNVFTHPETCTPETNYLVASDNETMVFPNDLKVDRDSNLWVLTDRLPVHIYKKLNYDEVNYRIFKGSAREIVKGTVCEVKDPVKPKEDKVSSEELKDVVTEKSVEKSSSSTAKA